MQGGDRSAPGRVQALVLRPLVYGSVADRRDRVQDRPENRRAGGMRTWKTCLAVERDLER